MDNDRIGRRAQVEQINIVVEGFLPLVFGWLSEAVILTSTLIQGRDVSYDLPYTGRYFLQTSVYRGVNVPYGRTKTGEIKDR